MVTSGAIARGRRLLGLDRRPTAVDELQAASAVGQGSLFRAYEDRLAAQRRSRRPGAADRLRHVGAHPLPERAPDAAAADRLARRPGRQRERHDRDRRDHLRRQRLPLRAGGDHGRGEAAGPAHRPGGPAQRRPATPSRRRAGRGASTTPRSSTATRSALRTSTFGSGGMRSKVVAAQMASRLGRRGDDLQRHRARERCWPPRAARRVGTTFAHRRGPRAELQALASLGGARSRADLRGRRRRPGAARGAARRCCRSGSSTIEGSFSAGDPVEVVGPDGIIGKGLAEHSSEVLERLRGKRSAEVAEILPGGAEEAIHRDRFVLT